MATAKKRKLVPWSKEDIKTLRTLAKEGVSGTKIAKSLKRTRGALYQRAAIEGISLQSHRIAAKKKGIRKTASKKVRA
jgi:hypothetical protein